MKLGTSSSPYSSSFSPWNDVRPIPPFSTPNHVRGMRCVESDRENCPMLIEREPMPIDGCWCFPLIESPLKTLDQIRFLDAEVLRDLMSILIDAQDPDNRPTTRGIGMCSEPHDEPLDHIVVRDVSVRLRFVLGVFETATIEHSFAASLAERLKAAPIAIDIISSHMGSRLERRWRLYDPLPRVARHMKKTPCPMGQTDYPTGH